MPHLFNKISSGYKLRWCLTTFICDFRLHEFDEQVKWVREGMAKVVPVPLLSLFTGLELETMVSALFNGAAIKGFY